MTEAVVCVSSRDATIGSGARARKTPVVTTNRNRRDPMRASASRRARGARVSATPANSFYGAFSSQTPTFTSCFFLFYVWMFPIPLIPAGASKPRGSPLLESRRARLAARAPQLPRAGRESRANTRADAFKHLLSSQESTSGVQRPPRHGPARSADLGRFGSPAVSCHRRPRALLLRRHRVFSPPAVAPRRRRVSRDSERGEVGAAVLERGLLRLGVRAKHLVHHGEDRRLLPAQELMVLSRFTSSSATFAILMICRHGRAHAVAGRHLLVQGVDSLVHGHLAVLLVRVVEPGAALVTNPDAVVLNAWSRPLRRSSLHAMIWPFGLLHLLQARQEVPVEEGGAVWDGGWVSRTVSDVFETLRVAFGRRSSVRAGNGSPGAGGALCGPRRRNHRKIKTRFANTLSRVLARCRKMSAGVRAASPSPRARSVAHTKPAGHLRDRVDKARPSRSLAFPRVVLRASRSSTEATSSRTHQNFDFARVSSRDQSFMR